MDLSWLWVVPILGVLIVVHEMGHFFTAIWLGIKVEEFGIGFPPRIFAVKHKGIDYSLNWLPIGGFVKIVGENGDSDDPKSFGKAPAWKRIIVLAAGSFMNLLLAIILFAVLAIAGTQEVAAPRTVIGDLMAGQPAAKAGVQPGDRIVQIAGQPVSSETDIRNLSAQHAGKPTQFVVDRNGQNTTLTITPNTASPSLGVYLDYYITPVTVDKVRSGDIAEQAGLKPGDEIVAVDGKQVYNLSEVAYYLSQDKSTATITVNRNVNRNGQTLDLKMDTSKVTGPQASYGFSPVRPIHMVYHNPLGALGIGLSDTWNVISLIPQGIAQAIAGQVQGPSVTGIVGISQLAGETAQDYGINGLLSLTALLGISLFMLNLLPLPALDGGRLLFILIELVRGGRRIAPEKEGLVHFAGMVVLLTLMLIITIFDVQRLFTGTRLTP